MLKLPTLLVVYIVCASMITQSTRFRQRKHDGTIFKKFDNRYRTIMYIWIDVLVPVLILKRVTEKALLSKKKDKSRGK